MDSNLQHTGDSAQRRDALDPSRSFIVQAPAGSGKTELLTQRFLKLLAMVDKPERVLAITFTRKATQEMRQRILKRIHQAEVGATQLPVEGYERTAVELAATVSSRDQQLGWDLLRNPARLQIHTIDGLCARIAGLQATPGVGVTGLQVIEDARPLYDMAVRRLIEDIGNGKVAKFVYSALTRLLVHLQGDAARLQTLLARMLSRRDQWLTLLEKNATGPERTLQKRQQLELNCLFDTLGQASVSALMEHLLPLTVGSSETVWADGLRAAIQVSGQDPTDTPGQVNAIWMALCTVATQAGAPYAPGSIERLVLATGGGSDRERHVEALKTIVDDWRQNETATAVFQRFVRNPPNGLNPGQDEILSDCIVLLKVADVELRLLFADQGQADFQYLAEMAMKSLGSTEQPGEALLYEDYRLSHILMDEFQDTSLSQFRLLRRLISGWQAGDGRSLFLVGDPMQSIYRFREANVSLFRQVFEQQQLGEIPLQTLQLRFNFRSRHEVINFVNKQFDSIFSQGLSISPGAVEYAHVEAARGSGGEVLAHTWPEPRGDAHEAVLVADLLVRKQAEHTDISVAILGRSRKHLGLIATELKQRGLAYEAVNVESLSSRPVIQDLLALLRAILHPADRVAWLALLRAPWLGLSPAELHMFAVDRSGGDTLSLLSEPTLMTELSPAAQARAGALGKVMRQVIRARGRLALHRLVEIAWISMKGPFAVGSQPELDNAQRFFKLIAEVEVEQPEDVLANVITRMDNFYSGSVASKVQLMTIHGAKGLEFDLVILPGLHKISGNSGQDFLRIEDFQFEDGSEGVLMAPIKGKEDKDPDLYNYLRMLNSEQEVFEAQRVLYVAATRAKQELHLFGAWKMTGSGANRKPGCPQGTFMKMLWPLFKSVIDPDVDLELGNGAQAEPPVLPYLRLENAPPLSISPVVPRLATFAHSLSLPDRDAMALGEAVHLWLELLHDHPPDDWGGTWLSKRRPALEASLINAGATHENLDTLYTRLIRILDGVMQDPAGRNILRSEGKAASWAELPFYNRAGMQLKKHIIDLMVQSQDGSFVIVDYKTGQDNPETRQKWQTQLDRYRSIVASYTGRSDSDLLVFQVETREFIELE